MQEEIPGTHIITFSYALHFKDIHVCTITATSCKPPPVVIVIQDFEGFSAHVLQSLVVSLR